MVVSRASGKEEIGASLQSSATWPALFVSSAVANRVSNRVLLAPMMRHTYFLALCTTVVQLAVYGAWLRRRIRRGLVTEPMWSFAKAKPLLLATFGLCEGAFFPLVFYSAARLPGSLVQVLNQTLIPFTVALSFGFLGKRYDLTQMSGVAIVLAGVLVVSSLPSKAPSALAFVLLCVAAYGLQAAAMVVKETVFSQYKRSEGGGRKPFDPALFLAAGTSSRCLVQVLAWPLYLHVTGGPGLRSCAAAGLQAVGAVLPLAAFYIAANVALSITALLMVQQTSAATTVLANVVALPLSALLFCLPLPLLEQQAFQWRLGASLLLVVLGNLLYSHRALKR
ncbi:unnamed protein product [Effrenium voratum]|nr:unnamed protein product [Effrenium voratum]